MSVEKETGIAALFDGDTQYNSYAPYHPFVDSDPDRLTLKSNSSITVDFGKRLLSILYHTMQDLSIHRKSMMFM